jgi:hypothetical protein
LIIKKKNETDKSIPPQTLKNTKGVAVPAMTLTKPTANVNPKIATVIFGIPYLRKNGGSKSI